MRRSKGDSKVITAHTAAVRSVCFSPNSRLLLNASDDKTLKVFGLPSRSFRCSLNGHSNWVRSAQFAPDGRFVVSGSDDKTVKLWDVEQVKGGCLCCVRVLCVGGVCWRSG